MNSAHPLLSDCGNTALIGHTGFVGSNLLGQSAYSACYNSRNIGDIAGRHFDCIICAGVSAVKWQANRDPEGDWRGIQPLLNGLEQVKTRKFILISTVDVYPDPRGVTEDLDPTPLKNHAYGTHRLRIEQFIASKFTDHHILRLPGLFGPGLKKNVIFDLLNARELEVIHPKGTYQYYDLARLSLDVVRMVERGIRLLNVATEPIATEEIIRRLFPNRTVGQRATTAGLYDFRSRHAQEWGGSDGYLYSAATVFDDLGRYLTGQPQYQIPTGQT